MKLKILNSSWQLIFCALLVFVLIIFIGTMVGFPGERIKMANIAKRYVKKEYGIIVTDVKVHVSIDGMNNVQVSTDELPFAFDVLISRNGKKVLGDLYLEKLIEYNIEEFIKKEIPGLKENEKIRVVLQNKFSRKSQELTVDEVNAQPEIILNTPNITYFCSIDINEKDLERIYEIFTKITYSYSPTSLYFHINSANSEELDIVIHERDFAKIHQSDDMLLFITQG